jgi:Predicted nucleotide-binding protein containing TIR-like domain
MNRNRRVFISAPRDVRLDPKNRGNEPRVEIKRAIIKHVEDAGYKPQIFLGPQGSVGLPAAEGGWSLGQVSTVLKGCVGAVLIGVRYWKSTVQGEDVWLPTDYCFYEGAIANALALPILAISVGIEERGIFDQHARVHSVSIPSAKDIGELQTDRFRGPFGNWHQQVQDRRDVFFGYCSNSASTAAQIRACLVAHGASVHDWAIDFRGGESILREIDDARTRCSCGVFLFSEDDPLEGPSGVVAPRDNVVFEAGYFMSAKGADRCLIVRHGNAKMPADVGGTIYVQLGKTDDVNTIDGRLSQFLDVNL